MSNKKKVMVIIIGLMALIGLVLFFSTVGSVKLPYGEILRNLIENDNPMVRTIVFEMRLPRNILAVLVGACLAASGALLQAVMRNPLADPGITGVSSGASIFAIIILLLYPSFSQFLPLFAFIGGAIACVLVYLLAWKNGLNPLRVVLAGVAINSIIGGFIALITTLYSDRIQGALLWLNGSLASKSFGDVKTVAFYGVIGLILSLLCTRSANILSLGDETAINLGFNINKTRLILSAVAVFLAAVATSKVGIISFVGLIVPHMSRMIIGSDYRYSLPFSMILGGVVLVLSDTLARSAFGSLEIPVGVVMSIMGGPFFLYLLRKRGSV